MSTSNICELCIAMCKRCSCPTCQLKFCWHKFFKLIINDFSPHMSLSSELRSFIKHSYKQKRKVFFIFLRNCPQQQRRGLVGRANRECSAGTRWISTLHCIRYTALHLVYCTAFDTLHSDTATRWDNAMNLDTANAWRRSTAFGILQCSWFTAHCWIAHQSVQVQV